jgi:mono/diheme cytochrome c family protein
MNRESANILTAEPAEPKAGLVTVPMWLVMLLAGVGYWSMVYFDSRGGWFNPQVYGPYTTLAEVTDLQPASDAEAFVNRGKVKFKETCALCHGEDGMGKPNQAPPLMESEWVNGPANRVIRIPLHGLSGPIQVKGQDWALAMPAMGAALPAEDLAAALSYIRQAWGNKSPAVTAEEVNAVKTATAGRSQPWTVDELKAIQ